MQQYVKFIAVQLVVVVFCAFAVSATVAAAPVAPGELPKVPATENTVGTILQILFAIIGAFALLNIVLSGFKYIRSAGDAGKTSEAKNGIINALIGLTIAITAEALVVFVVKGVG